MPPLNTIFCFLIIDLTIISPIIGAAISSKVDLDDDPITPPDTLSSSVLKAFVDINQGGGRAPKPSGVVSKPSRGFRRPSGRPVNNHEIDEDEDYMSIEDLFKKKSQQLHQTPIGATFVPGVQGFYGETDVKPTIINNIHVTINANESAPGVNGCKNGVCDVRVTSEPDGEGNVITNIHLSVVTKLSKPPVQIADIPVIEGTGRLRGPQFDQLPAFHFIDPVQYAGPFFDNNIPQIPIHRQDIDSWYHQPQPAVFHRTQPVWHYGRNLDRGFINSRPSEGRKSRTETTTRGIVDDKIETPLSKTNPETDKN